MDKRLYTLEEVNALIKEGRKLVITADERALDKLEAGDWIGGTLPYFMTDAGGELNKNKLYIDDFSDVCTEAIFKEYASEEIEKVTENNFENGFAYIILPFTSEVMQRFSLNALKMQDIFKNPLLGYVAGFDLNDTSGAGSFVYLGKNKTKTNDKAVVLHAKLPANKVARIEIINPFTIDENSPEFTFPVTSFEQSACKINGQDSNIADYLISINHPTMDMPFISSANGTLINRAVQAIDRENRKVSFYAPIHSDETYRMGKPMENATTLFIDRLKIEKNKVASSCLCLSFYVLGNLEGKIININGPFTFGEIAYQLLNLTAVILMIDSYD